MYILSINATYLSNLNAWLMWFLVFDFAIKGTGPKHTHSAIKNINPQSQYKLVEIFLYPVSDELAFIHNYVAMFFRY